MACSPEGSRVSGVAFVTTAYINRIGSAVPEHDVHQTFIRFVDQFLPDRKAKLLMKRMGLNPSIERTMVGFMGCAAAVNALKTAHHIVRSEPSAKVLVVNLELCTLHLQETSDLEVILAALLFGDGCAASLVSAEPEGIALKDFRVVTIPDTRDLITWRIGESGFTMTLSGEVPQKIAKALSHE